MSRAPSRTWRLLIEVRNVIVTIVAGAVVMAAFLGLVIVVAAIASR